mgnify:FL=1
MIDDLFLLIIIIGLIAFIAYQTNQFAKERKTFIRALLSRNVDDLNRAEMVDKVGKTKDVPDAEEEFLPVTADNPDAFDKMIKDQLES